MARPLQDEVPGVAASAGSPAPAARPAALLEVRGVSKRFGSLPVLRDISLAVGEGEFLTILGESGSGKTTLLRLVAGFEQVDVGEIWMAGERLDLLPPHRRRVNTVFQHYALFPHMTVFDNVAYGLRIRKTPKAELGTRVEEALQMVKMSAQTGSRPVQLSGGQQQRVALARALINRPRLLLLDEPLSALDANLRRQMQVELKALQRQLGIAFVFVTHDQQEAMAMSDRVALLRGGRLEQVASPREIYQRPATAYVAQFVGQTNLLRCRVEGGMVRCASLAWPCSLPAGDACFSLRPESIRIAGPGLPPPGTVRFRASLRHRVFHGATELLHVEAPGGMLLLVRTAGSHSVAEEAEFEFAVADAVPVREEEN